MAGRPIPEEIMTELSNYVATLPDGREKLFNDRFSPKKWEKVRHAMKLPDLKFHDLRKTFASQLTNDIYTNVDPVLRQAIDQLPVAEWI